MSLVATHSHCYREHPHANDENHTGNLQQELRVSSLPALYQTILCHGFVYLFLYGQILTCSGEPHRPAAAWVLEGHRGRYNVYCANLTPPVNTGIKLILYFLVLLRNPCDHRSGRSTQVPQ